LYTPAAMAAPTRMQPDTAATNAMAQPAQSTSLFREMGNSSRVVAQTTQAAPGKWLGIATGASSEEVEAGADATTLGTCSGAPTGAPSGCGDGAATLQQQQQQQANCCRLKRQLHCKLISKSISPGSACQVACGAGEARAAQAVARRRVERLPAHPMHAAARCCAALQGGRSSRPGRCGGPRSWGCHVCCHVACHAGVARDAVTVLGC
jgi:hypothetical protein